MTRLLRASDLVGRPVVTLRGDEVGEVKDVLLGLTGACLVGFTLRNPGFLGGPQRRSLPWASVRAVGADAVMVTAEGDLGDREDVPSHGDAVQDLPVMSTDGELLGRIVDVVVETEDEPDVVGFAVEPGPGGSERPGERFLPVDDMVSVSEQALVVPAEAAEFLHDDLSGFGAVVAAYRRGDGGHDRAAE